MYELVYGSIFDKKCDIIIPGNQMGEVTRSVERNLIAKGTLMLPTVKEPGDIAFGESQGNFTNALVIGFAASVDGITGRSKLDYLHKICKKIKDYCEFNSLSIINMPLLGTGHGGLSVRDSFEILKSYFESEANINLKIFAFSKEIYSQLDKIEKL